MRAIGYVRVSTDKQAEGGISLEAQTEKLRAMAIVQDCELLDILVDAGESAKNLNRPAMTRLLALVDTKAVDTVIVHKLDRLTRSVRDLGELLERFQKRGVTLVSLSESLDTGTAAGRLVLNLLMSVSQWEREAIGERTRDAMRHLKAKGVRAGEIPYGYHLAGDSARLEPCSCEQVALSRLRELRASGCALRTIAKQLNLEGHATRRGTPWQHQYVANVLRLAAWRTGNRREEKNDGRVYLISWNCG